MFKHSRSTSDANHLLILTTKKKLRCKCSGLNDQSHLLVTLCYSAPMSSSANLLRVPRPGNKMFISKFTWFKHIVVCKIEDFFHIFFRSL